MTWSHRSNARPALASVPVNFTMSESRELEKGVGAVEAVGTEGVVVMLEEGT